MGIQPEINASGRIRLVLNPGIYSMDAVTLAARVLSDRSAVEIGAATGRKIVVFLQASNPRWAAGEFLNEALNQQCRIDLAGKNSVVASLISVRALLSASAKGRKAVRRQAGGGEKS